MTAIRKEKPVGYTRMVTRSIVDGLRKVFTDAYAEKQLKGLRISPEFPLTRNEYPMVLVEFDDRVNRNAGVGHSERFYDLNGVLRDWQHRLFEGTLTFTVMTLSPLDRDVMYDAIFEVLSFGRMSHLALQNNLYTKLYGDPDDEDNSPVLLEVLAHLALNTDIITGGGKSASLAPWGPEDVMVFEKSLSIDIHGGYYNSMPADDVPGTEMVTNVFLYPKLVEVVALPIWEGDDNWGHESDDGALDANVVTATFTASAVEQFVDGP